MAEPEPGRDNAFISRMSWIAFFLAFLVMLLGIIMNY